MDDQTSKPSSSSSAAAASSVRLGGRTIDRHNPIIRDGRRFTPPPSPNPNIPSSSHHRNHRTDKTKLSLNSCDDPQEQSHATQKNKKKKKNKNIITPQGSSRYLLENPVFFDGFVDSDPVPIPADPVNTEPVGFVISDPVPIPTDPVNTKPVEIENSDPVKVPVEVVKDIPEKIEPEMENKEDRLIINASKYISSSFLEKKQSDFFDGFLDYDYENKDFTTTPYVPIQSSPPVSDKKPSSDQVVVLRVSLHCKGCAGKVRKHLSRMKGVTSFNVDFAAKKVTVTGDVTPLGVLASVSKVKNAQFWPETRK